MFRWTLGAIALLVLAAFFLKSETNAPLIPEPVPLEVPVPREPAQSVSPEPADPPGEGSSAPSEPEPPLDEGEIV